MEDNVAHLVNVVNTTLDLKNSSVKTSLALYDFLIPVIGLLIIIANLAVALSSGLILKNGNKFFVI